MITAPPGSIYATILDLVRRYPGEYSDRALWVGKVCIAGVPEVGETALPKRWPERMREAGMLRPARVRLAVHVQAALREGDRHHIEREEGQARRILEALSASDDGLGVGDLALAVGSGPSGSTGGDRGHPERRKKREPPCE